MNGPPGEREVGVPYREPVEAEERGTRSNPRDASVLALQHAAGNRAVLRMLQVARAPARSSAGAPGVPAISHYEETTLPDGRIEIHGWGVVGDPIPESGMKEKFPLPQDIGRPDLDRWHLVSPDAVGAEDGIAYAPRNFNLGKTKRIENIVRRARAAVRQQGGQAFYDFKARCRVLGEHDGVRILVLDDVTWDVEVRAAGSDTIVPVIHTTESATAPATPTAAPTGSQPPPVEAPPKTTPEPETKGPATEPGAAKAREEPPVAESGGGVEPPGEGPRPGAEGGMTPQGAAEGGAVWLEQKGIEGYEALQDEKAEAEFKRYEPDARRRAAEGNWVVLKAWFIEAPPNMAGDVAKDRLDAREFSEVTMGVGSTKDEALGDPATGVKATNLRPEDASPDATHPKGKSYKSYVRLTKVFPPDPDVEKLISGYADFIGTYHPVSLDQENGDSATLRQKAWNRELKLTAGRSADPSSVVKMWTVEDDGSKREWNTVWTSGNDPTKGIKAVFVERAGAGSASYNLLCEIKYMYTPGGDRVYEHVKVHSGKDTTPAADWSGVFIWKQDGQSK